MDTACRLGNQSYLHNTANTFDHNQEDKKTRRSY